MDTIALRFFLEVARTGSIAAASERVHVAPSVISRRIAALEFQLGVILFERQPRGMTLTTEGEILAGHVRRSILEEDRVVSDIKSLGARTTGTIQIVTSEGLASNFVPEVVHAYRQHFPDIRFAVRSQTPKGIAWEVREGLADVGSAFAAGADLNISVLHRLQVSTLALMAPTHPLARAERLPLRELQPYPLATSKASTLRRLLDQRSTFEGLKFNIVYECNASASLFNYVAQGQAIALAAELSARNWLRRGDLVGVAVAGREAFSHPIELQVMKGRGLPAYVESWIGHLRDALQPDHDWRAAEETPAASGFLPRLVQ